MKTKTLSTRLTEQECLEFDQLVGLSGLDRAGLLKQLLRQGILQMKWELAVKAYRENRVSLSRASEMAGVGIRDFMARMPSEQLELSYGVDELAEDLQTLEQF